MTGDHYPSQLFANPGHGNHWLTLKLEGVQSNRPAIGARIKIVARTDSGEREIHRVVGSRANFGASPLRQEIGLGRARSISRMEIFWPRTGLTQVIREVELDRCYSIKEGDTAAHEVLLKKFAWPSSSTAHPSSPRGAGYGAGKIVPCHPCCLLSKDRFSKGPRRNRRK